jgi:hypothetical protein
MSEEEARSFADRLPPVVPRAEADISHLSDAMAEVLYPGRRPRPFRMGVVFDGWEGEGGPRAVSLARAADVYAEEAGLNGPRHRAEFGPASARRLQELFALVGPRPETEVLFDGKRVPYARELWMPLFWILIRS